MQQLFTVDALISLLTLTVLEIVLGIDNVIFVSILHGPLNEKQRLCPSYLDVCRYCRKNITTDGYWLAGKQRQQGIVWIQLGQQPLFI